MRIEINKEGRCIALGVQANYSYAKPEIVNINFDNFNRWVCNDINDINNPEVWMLGDPPVPDAFQLKKNDIEFGNSLLLEFLTGQKDIQLDSVTYRAVSEVFKYAEAALRRGDIPQAKTELTNIAPTPPVWTQDTKDYFINKINQYL